MDASSARGQWREVGEVLAGSHSYKVQHLEEKNKYKFRIRALNKIGKSEPADLQDTVLAKDPWGKFKQKTDRHLHSHTSHGRKKVKRKQERKKVKRKQGRKKERMEKRKKETTKEKLKKKDRKEKRKKIKKKEKSKKVKE